MKIRRNIWATMVLLCSIQLGAVAQTTVPDLINYQGRLTDTAGNPLADDNYILSFSIYDAATGGNLIWGPQEFDGQTATGHGDMVPAVQGYFNVILGPSDIKGDSIVEAFKVSGRWIEVKINASPILPRQQILSAPYAQNANMLAGQVLSTIVPSGMVASFALNTCPPGWTEYAPAYGRFIRGIDRSGESRDPDGVRTIESVQEDAFKAHVHTERPGSGTRWYAAAANDGNWPDERYGNQQTNTTGSTGDQETRPKNVALLYCSKD